MGSAIGAPNNVNVVNVRDKECASERPSGYNENVVNVRGEECESKRPSG